MAVTHTLPSSLWNDSLAMDASGLVAAQANFQPLIRQHNTMVASGAPLFSVATLLPTVTSSETFYWETPTTGWEPVRQLTVLRQRVLWDEVFVPDGEALLIEDETGEVETCDDGWFAGHPEGWLNLARPLDGWVRFSYTISVDQPDGTVGFCVVPTPPGAVSDNPSLEGDGYLADARANPGKGVSTGVMQTMMDGIGDVLSRPIGIVHTAYCPTLTCRSGESGLQVLPGIPYFGRGLSVGLSARGYATGTPALVLYVDGVEATRIDTFPVALSTETPLERATPGAAIPEGWHTLTVAPTCGTSDVLHLVSLSLYEVA